MAGKSIIEHTTLDQCCDTGAYVGVIAGVSESGKTVLVADTIKRGLLAAPALWAQVFIMSPTADLQSTWSGFQDIYPDPETYPGLIGDILVQQRENHGSGKVKPILVILDDILGAVSKQTSAEFKNAVLRLVTSGRHLKMHVYILSQSLKNPLVTTPDVRTNMRWVASAACASSSREELEKLIGCRDKDTRNILDECWKVPYRFIVCKLTEQSDSKISFCKINIERTPEIIMKYG